MNTWCYDNGAEVSFIWKLVRSEKKFQEKKRINILPKENVQENIDHFSVTFALFTVLLA